MLPTAGGVGFGSSGGGGADGHGDEPGKPVVPETARFGLFQGIEAPQSRQDHHEGTAENPQAGDQWSLAPVVYTTEDLTDPEDLLSISQ